LATVAVLDSQLQRDDESLGASASCTTTCATRLRYFVTR
jgi:glyceraldehyde-3-phosphate dehydrogenase/erythrose-4-phosphate dehydrogenase